MKYTFGRTAVHAIGYDRNFHAGENFPKFSKTTGGGGTKNERMASNGCFVSSLIHRRKHGANLNV